MIDFIERVDLEANGNFYKFFEIKPENNFSLTLRRLLESYKRGEKSKVDVKYLFIKDEDP